MADKAQEEGTVDESIVAAFRLPEVEEADDRQNGWNIDDLLAER